MKLLLAKLLWTTSVLVWMTVLTCCSSTSSPQKDPFSTLAKDMTEQQVRDTVGAPSTIMPGAGADAAKTEIWVYRRSLPVRVRQVITGSETMTGYDPITGQEYKYSVPIYHTQTDSTTQTIELLMVDGRFAGRRDDQSNHPSFH